jgi:transglutaminase superfamily protein
MSDRDLETQKPDEPQLEDVERRALRHLDAEAGQVEAELDETPGDVAPAAERLPVNELVAIALNTIAAAVMVGGVFLGVSPRIYAGLGGLFGIALAIAVMRVRNPVATLVAAAAGLFVVGLVVLLPFGVSHLFTLRHDVQQAIAQARLLRPPLDFSAGWAAMTAWVMACIGFGCAWLAIGVRKGALAALIPLAVAAFATISVPGDAQIASGIAVVVLFGASLGAISGSRGESQPGLPRAYEIRRALRSLPVVAGVAAALIGATYTGFLFPHPLYDPSQAPQKPHPESLTSAPDRDLFDVSNTTVTGPWVVGHLDIYDGQNWLLPPYAKSELIPVQKTGIVDGSMPAGAKATFTVRGLTGAVLPGLPDMIGVIAEGPKLAYDFRNGNIRLVEGSINPGFSYTVVAAGPVDVNKLAALGTKPDFPGAYKQFAEIPSPPPAVKDLIKQAPKDSLWAEYDFLRNWVLQNVTAAGSGVPVPIAPDRVQQIVQQRQATPYEIVAVQAMLARWIGLPSRIGYGFDGGTNVNGHLEIHPRNGTSFPEVYFPGYEWVPVIGTPAHAKSNLAGNKQANSAITPSQEIGVPLYVPYLIPQSVPLYQQLQPVAVSIVLAALVILALYLLIPLVAKFLRLQRRRRLAARRGLRAELELAYIEWRDHATDFGYEHGSDTPLMFTDRFTPDDQHTEFAWLVTRALWGDLQGDITPDLVVTAKEYSRRLKSRLSQAHPITLRVVALFSRLSLQHPYVVDTAVRGQRIEFPLRRRAA